MIYLLLLVPCVIIRDHSHEKKTKRPRTVCVREGIMNSNVMNLKWFREECARYA